MADIMGANEVVAWPPFLRDTVDLLLNVSHFVLHCFVENLM